MNGKNVLIEQHHLFLTLGPATGSGLWPNFFLILLRLALSAKPKMADLHVASWPHPP